MESWCSVVLITRCDGLKMFLYGNFGFCGVVTESASGQIHLCVRNCLKGVCMPKCKGALEENVKSLISESGDLKQTLVLSAESVGFLRFCWWVLIRKPEPKLLPF